MSNQLGELNFYKDHLSGVTGTLENKTVLNMHYGEIPKIIQVRTTTIDSIRFQDDYPIDILKIDVEGHQLKVLEGAEKAIKTDLPILLIELGGLELGCQYDAFNFLKNLGYIIFDQQKLTIAHDPPWDAIAISPKFIDLVDKIKNI
ncbi:hypothetical protein A7Q10_02120 [Methylacidiphilum caldifontis]|uniref:Methyltransferase FkbM domain-containing protein n=1 Tax=Methylacidiphilum caldifontis TaxID=2795386 RepID=A0A4Y8PAS0_9BACT|nr:hypothetical protein A7Q10_02120 [Methylacidiphilum caldifontis]